MLIEEIQVLIGEVPPGCEPLLFVAAVMILLWLLSTVFSIFWSVISWIGGK